MNKQRVWGFLTIAATVILWQLVCSLHLLRPLFLPSPGRVARAFWDTRSTIAGHSLSTLFRTSTGFVLGSLCGLLTGLLMSLNKMIFHLLDPLVESLRPVPAIAVLPFFILWFGIGNFGQILLITLSCAVIITVETYVAVTNVPLIYLRASASLGADRIHQYRTVIVPAILPHLAAGLRIAWALAFTIAIAAEFMGAQRGIGFVIMRARRTLETQTILLGILIIGFMSTVLDTVLRRILGYLTRWAETATNARA